MVLHQLIEERPWLWATHVWNMFDFAADGRDEGGKHGENQKGLVTIDRELRKDAFYLYKAVSAYSAGSFSASCAAAPDYPSHSLPHLPGLLTL